MFSLGFVKGSSTAWCNRKQLAWRDDVSNSATGLIPFNISWSSPVVKVGNLTKSNFDDQYNDGRYGLCIDECFNIPSGYDTIFIYFDYLTIKFRGSGYSNCFVSLTTSNNATSGDNINGAFNANFGVNANTDFNTNLTRIWYVGIGKYNGYILPWNITNGYGNAFISGQLVLCSTINQYNMINYITIDYKVSLYVGTFQT